MRRQAKTYLPIGLALAMLLAGGCAPLRVPAIDPSGRQLFDPSQSTELLCPVGADGLDLLQLPEPAFAQPQTPPWCSSNTQAWEGPGQRRWDLTGSCGWSSSLARRALFPATAEAGVVLTPQQLVAPVGSEVVLLGGVCGGDGYYRKAEPIQWVLEEGSVGTFIELARPERPLLHYVFRGPVGGKVTHRYAVGETLRDDETIDRGTIETTDDVALAAGQAWISLTSGSEGTSRVTFLAHEVPNWWRRQAQATIHWIDGEWTFPAPQFNGGSSQPLTTTVRRRSDSMPVTGWLVRYEIVGGAPAGFGDQQSQVVEVPTDGAGQATVMVSPLGAADGATQIRIQVIRPGKTAADPGRITLGEGVTVVQWSTANVTTEVQALTPTGAVGDQIGFRILVSNLGSGLAQNVAVVANIPDGTEWATSTPLGQVFYPQVRWTIPNLNPRQRYAIDVGLVPRQPGVIQFCAATESGSGGAVQQCASAQISGRPIQVTVSGAENAEVGDYRVFDITITNQTGQALSDVTIRNVFSNGMRNDQGSSPLRQTLPALAAGQATTLQIGFEFTAAGRQCQQIEVIDGQGNRGATEHCVQVREPARPGVTLRATPSRTDVTVGENVDWSVTVENTGATQLSGVQLSDQFDPAWQFVMGSEGVSQSGNQLVWNYATPIPAGARVTFAIRARALFQNPNACHRLRVTSAEGATADIDSCVVIRAADGGAGTPPAGVPPRIAPDAGGARPAGPGADTGLDVALRLRPEDATVGDEVEVTITIQNWTNRMFSRVEPVLRIPESIELARAADGSRFDRNRREVLFLPTEVIRPRDRAITYLVSVRPTQPGPFDLTLEVASPDLAPSIRRVRTLRVNAAGGN